MVATGGPAEESSYAMEILPIHFDVPGHYLSLRTFIETSRQTEFIIANFNREFFYGKLNYEIIVLPPSQGSFKTRLGVAVIAVGASVWAILESDIGKAFVEGLTGHEPAHWARSAGLELREFIEDLSKLKGEEEKSVSASACRGEIGRAHV